MKFFIKIVPPSETDRSVSITKSTAVETVFMLKNSNKNKRGDSNTTIDSTRMIIT